MHNTLDAFLKWANDDKKPTQESLFATDGKVEIRNKTTKKVIAKDKNGDFKKLEELFQENWIDEWYDSKAEKEAYYKNGKRIIKEFYEQFAKNPPKILKINGNSALEMPFNLKIGGYTLYGVIDRIDELEGSFSTSSERLCSIIDYKTGQSKDKLDADAKEQLLIYQIAAQEVLHLKPKQLAYYYLDDGKIASFLGSEIDLENQKAKIIEEIEKIKNSEFDPTPGWQCQYCDFKDICDHAQR
jgi:CRISPR/Cas system-associated exonuclease Cas4 (RecB family)